MGKGIVDANACLQAKSSAGGLPLCHSIVGIVFIKDLEAGILVWV